MKLELSHNNEGFKIGPLFGIFFEDINHAADGGLYPELVRNRSFEFNELDNRNYNSLTAWETIGNAKATVEDWDHLFDNNPHYLVLRCDEAGSGIKNLGFGSGMSLKAGADYKLKFYAKNVSDDAGVAVTFKIAGVEEQFVPGNKWECFEKTVTAKEDVKDGNLLITVSGKSVFAFDFISLYPVDTYKGRENGLRRDLAEALEALNPKFLRFPGGCLVHDGKLDSKARDSQYRWKNTIGRLEDRPARRNNWEYNQTLGLGYFEYFLLAEDLGAKPLPVLPGGYDPHHFRAASIGDVDGKATGELAEFIQDALDLIEFANGDSTTEYGKLRSQLGHKEPFNLEYIGIGNEEIGKDFFDRFPYFERAIHEKYPDIKIIGTSGPFAAGREYDYGWKSAKKDGADLVDEHYYMNPEWMINNVHRYDKFDPNGPKVFVGEYASWGNTWYNALYEAAFMTGLQNNADKVEMACYAPLFCNSDYVNWRPDMIWFNSGEYFNTPNYYVQKLFMNHQGTKQLDVKVLEKEEDVVLDSNTDTLAGDVVLEYSGADARYSDILVTGGVDDSVPLKRELFIDSDHKEAVVARTSSNVYSIRLKVQEISGKQGFRINFGRKSSGFELAWILGGWANSDSIIELKVHGRPATLAQNAESVEPGKVYDLLIWVMGRKITTFINGKLDHSIELPLHTIEEMYVTSSIDENSGDTIIKAVNIQNSEKKLDVFFTDLADYGWIGTEYSMRGYADDAENSFANPEAVLPGERPISFDERDISLKVPPKSLMVYRIKQNKAN